MNCAQAVVVSRSPDLDTGVTEGLTAPWRRGPRWISRGDLRSRNGGVRRPAPNTVPERRGQATRAQHGPWVLEGRGGVGRTAHERPVPTDLENAAVKFHDSDKGKTRTTSDAHRRLPAGPKPENTPWSRHDRRTRTEPARRDPDLNSSETSHQS